MDLEIEHWADTGEPTAVELKQHLMVDKGIIEVSPKQAAMPPGGKQAIRLRMRHQRADEYELPLLGNPNPNPIPNPNPNPNPYPYRVVEPG